MITTVALAAIDVRECGEAEAVAIALEGFDALAVGEALVVLARDAGPGLLAALQGGRKGMFEWSLLESGPERFRIQVARRGARPGELRGVSEALGWDHDRLDALEEDAFQRLAAGDAEGARGRWSEFVVGLLRHIRFEEEVLFPEFEARCGAGPTEVMRFEHRGIEALVEAIGEALAAPVSALALREQLHDLLGMHNVKEEHVLYPATDRSLRAEERDALVARIQAVS